MAIEIIPKQKLEKKKTSILDMLYYFAVSLPFFLFLIYLGVILFHNRAEARLAELDFLIAQQETPEAKALEKKVLKQKEKIDIFSNILLSYKKSSPCLELLKSVCHKQVVFTNAEIISEMSQIILSAETNDFKTLIEQILLFKQEPLIENVQLIKGSVQEEGGIAFGVILSIDVELFKGFDMNENIDENTDEDINDINNNIDNS